MNYSKTIKIFISFLLLVFAINVSSQNHQQVISTETQQKAEYYLKLLQVNYDNGDYIKHKAYSDSLLSVATKHNLFRMKVLAYTNQAISYKNRSERLKAIELFHKALNVCEEIPEDYRTKIIVLVNMGNIYNDIGSFKKSTEYMQKVLKLLDANENSNIIRAAALIGLANNYAEFNDYENTIFYSEKAKALGEKIGNEDVIISAVNNISDIYIISKDYKKALNINKSVSDIGLLDKPTKKKASFLLNNGIANYHLNNLDEALLNLKACQALSKEKQILETQMYAHEFLAKVYEQKKNYKSTILEQKKYREIRELFLKDKKDASNADLNQEIDSKSEIIADNNEELKGFSKNKALILTICTVLLLLLGGFLYYNIKRKKKLKEQQLKLQDQYRALQNDFSNYKKEASNEPLTQSSNSFVKKEIKPYKNSSLTPENREEYKAKILAFMTTEKPFLNSEMTQSDLAKELSMSSNHFSEVLYYNFEQNFYNFVNSYRILEAQKMMKDSNYKNTKILAIAFDSGFKSKSTFNRIFKNHTGITPSVYRNQIAS